MKIIKQDYGMVTILERKDLINEKEEMVDIEEIKTNENARRIRSGK